MDTIPLTLCYKGGRSYLQGADIYTGIAEQLLARYDGRSIRAFRLAIHGFASHQLELLLSGPGEDAVPSDEHRAADFRCTTAAGPINGSLRETEMPVDCRNPYEEEKIAALCDTDDKTISIRGDSGYSAIEVVVSMTKQLHYLLFPIENGRWIFSRLDLAELLRHASAGSLSVTQEQNLHNRITRSRIEVAGTKIGNIYFSVASGN